MTVLLDADRLHARIDHHLRVLVDEIGARPPGSPANRRATDHVAATLTAAGRRVTQAPFTTRWWEPGPGTLQVAGRTVEVQPNPYSPPCDVTGPVVRLETAADLDDGADLRGRVVVLGPALAGETVMPKTFPFLQIDEHRRLVAFLEDRDPAAVVGISERYRSMATFEDPDLAFPSVTVGADLGASLGPDVEVRVRLAGQVHAGAGVNVSSPADTTPRVVLSAHVDSKVTTPGAFDNAASVAVLLALTEVAPAGDLAGVEIVPFNGEDHFDACGEQAWLAASDLSDVALNINLDGAGVAGRDTSVATLACPDPVERAVSRLVGATPRVEPTDPWYESDHSIFAMRGVPAVAISCVGVHDLLAGLAHTPGDTRDVVDIDVCVDVARLVHALVQVDGLVATQDR